MRSLTEKASPWLRAATVVGIVTVGTLWGASRVLAEPESPVTKINAAAAASPVTVQSLRGNISVLMGSGGNITVLAGKDGKLLVDAGIAVSKEKISAALARISAAPLSYLIDTHWHWDHTDGNAWVHDAGATIIGLRQTLARVSATTRVEDWNYTFPPVPPAGFPTVFVKSRKTLSFDGESLAIRTYERHSHTDGDLSVYFKKADIISTGDTFWNGWYPFIDYSTGGSIDGAIRAAKVNVAMAGSNTIVIPGHGPVGNKARLIAFRDMLVTIRRNVAALKQQGMTVDQVVAARPSAAFDADWGQAVIDPAFFVKLVYKGV
jgi:glyoxylase-like metal-dependent hydrolase (beta-lactamase superfamily II)